MQSTAVIQKEQTEEYIVLPRGYSSKDIYMAAMLYMNKPRKVIVEDDEREANVFAEKVKETCQWATSSLISMYVMCGMGECIIDGNSKLHDKVKQLAESISAQCEKIGLKI